MPANLFRSSFCVRSYLRRLTFKRADELRKTLRRGGSYENFRTPFEPAATLESGVARSRGATEMKVQIQGEIYWPKEIKFSIEALHRDSPSLRGIELKSDFIFPCFSTSHDFTSLRFRYFSMHLNRSV